MSGYSHRHSPRSTGGDAPRGTYASGKLWDDDGRPHRRGREIVDPAEVVILLAEGARTYLKAKISSSPYVNTTCGTGFPRALTAAKAAKWRRSQRPPHARYRYIVELWESEATVGAPLLLCIESSLHRDDRAIEGSSQLRV